MKLNIKCLEVESTSINNISYFALGCLCIFAITYLSSIDMFAVSASSNAISNTLCKVVNLLTGTAGKAIATIALIFLAIGLFVGKLSWGLAIAIAIGIGGIFGAEKIVGYISGETASNCGSISFAHQFTIAFNLLQNRS